MIGIDDIVSGDVGGIPTWAIVLVGGGMFAFLLMPKKSNQPAQALAVPFAEPQLISAPGPQQVTNIIVDIRNMLFRDTTPAKTGPVGPTAPLTPPASGPISQPTPVAAPAVPTPAPAPAPTPTNPCDNMTQEQALQILIGHADSTFFAPTMLWSFNRNLISQDVEDRARAGDSSAIMQVAQAWVQIHNINLPKFVCDKGWAK